MFRDRCTALGAERRSLPERLPALKRRGCNLLVTGDVSERTATRATRRLFGDPTLARTRVLVHSSDTEVDDLLPATVDRDDPMVTVIDATAVAAPATEAAEADSDAADTDDPLAVLEAAVVERADAFGATSPRRTGGEFRLAVTSLDRLRSDHAPGAVERFLCRTTEAVRSVRGLGHYRYAGPRSDLSALPLDRLFDGFVELRDRPDVAQRISCPQTEPTNWVEF